MDGGYLVEQLVNGLATGSIYALIAVGYAMVYSILYLINFAHGDVIMFGAFCALTLIGMAFPVPAAILAACIAGACIALAVERLAYRPVRHANRIVPMISALGAGLVLASLAHLIWGPEVQPFPQLIPRGTVTVLGVAVPQQALAILLLSFVLVVAASLLLERTRLGRATKCVCQDLYAAQLMGIPVNLVIPMVYAVGGFLGVAGGVLFAMYFNAAFIQMGLLATTKAWAGAMLGGVGNFYGAALGGLLLGMAEMLAVVTVGSAYKDGVSLVIIVAVLLLRPQGLFGGRRVERS
jgi:branched-chain amino acid transport system permease protein